MKKKAYHKNSKKPVSKTPKPNIKRGRSKERFLLLDKIILLLYLGVGFLPHMNAFDVAITQWYYISIVNAITLAYIYYYKNFIEVDFHHKIAKFTFLGALLFLFISCLSIVKSISVSESIVFLCILLNTLIALFNLYIILKDKLVELFPFMAYVLLIFLAIETLQVLHHFVVINSNQPRSESLFYGLNPTYGNRNILAASLIIKMAFTFYILFVSKKKVVQVLCFLVVFLTVFSVLLIGSRTAIYSLPIIFSSLIFGCFYINKEKNFIILTKNFLIPLLLVCGIAFISSLSVNKIDRNKLNSFNDLIFTRLKKDLYKANNVSTNDGRALSLASDGGRMEFWISAIDGFKSSPLLGVGLGNWKMIEKEELVLSKKNQNHFYPRRAHNDFLQVLSEMGIVGFIIFIGLFCLVYYILIKTSIFSNEDRNIRFIALVVLVGFLTYTLDSLINFPSERTPIQVLGVLIMTIALAVIKRDGKIKLNEYLKFGFAFLVLILIYLNYQMFTSAKYQMIVRNNIRGKNILKEKYKVGYNQMNDLYPSFPKLNFMGQPIDYAKAVLAYSEGKYSESMNHLNLAIKESPYSLEHYAFKSMIFRSNKVLKNQDSCIYYAKKAFYKRPGLINQYRVLKKHYIDIKDTISLLDLISRHQSFLPRNEAVWIDKINFYLKYHKDVKRASGLIDSAKLVLPNNKKIQELRIVKNNKSSEVVSNSDSLKLKRIELQKILNGASELFSQKRYKEAQREFIRGLEIAPTNEEIRLSSALTDIKMKRYNDAIEKLNKVISSGKITNGKPEYNRGLCYLRLKKNKLAGIDFRASYDKGFAMAKKLDKRILNY
ncbi:O-antigen ligase family protein [Tenacibaculum sp. 190524A05c]|uniref:O-antigen ligase family protein n=1 Tax=Tenacibaculum platacis TaxID=3137852 RepID=UPI0032B2B124